MGVLPTHRKSVLRSATGGLSATVIGLACVAVLAGCAGGGRDGDGPARLSMDGAADRSSDRIAMEPGTAVRSVAEVLGRAGSSRVRTLMEVREASGPALIHGTGMFDYRKRLGLLKVTLPAVAPNANAGPITELVTPGVLYMRNRDPRVPKGAWVRVTTAELTDGNLVINGATDPVLCAELLRGAEQVAMVGSQMVDGVRVRHLRGRADLVAAADRASGVSSTALHAGARSFTVTKVPFDAFLDDQGRLRKVRQEFTFRSVSSTRKIPDEVKVISTTELYDFGRKVEIAAPEHTDVYDVKISPAVPAGSSVGR